MELIESACESDFIIIIIIIIIRGVCSSRIHFSRDEQTPKDDCGEATVSFASSNLKYCDETLLFIFIFRLFQAVQKIRNYVMEKIYQFRRPMTNYQIPQNALLKYR